MDLSGSPMFRAKHIWHDRKDVWEINVGRARGSKDGHMVEIWSVAMQFVWPEKAQAVAWNK